MSKLNLYAVHDSKAGMYNRPMPSTNDQTAIRGFIAQAINPESDIHKNQYDYSLFRIGQYDEESSIITPETPPEFLINAEQANLNDNKVKLQTKLAEKNEYGSLITTYEKLAIEITHKTQQLDEKLKKLNHNLVLADQTPETLQDLLNKVSKL